MTDPLLVTLQLEDRAFERFDGERRRWFPAELDHVPAHVSLFHQLPGEHLDEVAGALEDVADEHAPFTVEATGVRFLGRGSAYTLQSDELAAVHGALAERFAPWLTEQDRQPYRPHVTIQNKVEPDEAKRTFAELEAGFAPFTFTATGLELWWYRGGPWAPADVVPFAGAADQQRAGA